MGGGCNVVSPRHWLLSSGTCWTYTQANKLTLPDCGRKNTRVIQFPTTNNVYVLDSMDDATVIHATFYLSLEHEVIVNGRTLSQCHPDAVTMLIILPSGLPPPPSRSGLSEPAGAAAKLCLVLLEENRLRHNNLFQYTTLSSPGL